ncbi:MAG: class II aldolase/adducin family protein [Acidobacteriota bacterium]
MAMAGETHDDEAAIRHDLVTACRLFARFGWTDLGATHLSTRLKGSLEERFIINPHGCWLGAMREDLLYRHSLRAENDCLRQGEQKEGVGVAIHSAIYTARKDIHCVLHTHTTAGIAVSMQESGLQMLSNQAAMFFGKLAYHEARLGEDEPAGTARDLAKNDAMILRHHGLLVCGRNVPEAFVRMHLLQRACESQIAGQMAGVPLLPMLTEVCVAISGQADALIHHHASAVWPTLSHLVSQNASEYAHFPLENN